MSKPNLSLLLLIMSRKKNLIFFLIFVLITNCSFDNKTGIWTGGEKERKRVGNEVIGKKFSNNLKENLTKLSKYFEDNEIGNIKTILSDERYHPEYKFQCLGCFQARENGGPVCNFTKGMIEGFLEFNYGNRYEIGERQKDGTLYESCVFPMRRTKKRGRAEAINIE